MATGERSRESLSMPTSFSTWIMMTVCCCPSISLMCRIRAAKARASASRLASPKALSTSMLLPSFNWARGYFSKSFFSQSGG